VRNEKKRENRKEQEFIDAFKADDFEKCKEMFLAKKNKRKEIEQVSVVSDDDSDDCSVTCKICDKALYDILLAYKEGTFCRCRDEDCYDEDMCDKCSKGLKMPNKYGSCECVCKCGELFWECRYKCDM